MTGLAPAAPPAKAPAIDRPAIDRKVLMAAIAPYQVPSLRRSVWQFGSTFVAYLATIGAMYAAAHVSAWLVLALAVPAAGLVVRLFIVQHDCGHGSFFRSRRANDWLGRFCSAMTFAPYEFWRRQHANHHSSFNNLDRRDSGLDIYSTCATVREYEALSPARRGLYRAARHPALTLFLLPPVVFVLLYRLPFDTPASAKRERRSVLGTNAALLGVVGVQAWLLGAGPVLLVQGTTIALASIVGVWLFSVQHRFEEAQWARADTWNPVQASLDGSSYLKLPRLLQWFTGNIGFHHVHHLSPRVPNYRLQACHEARPEMGQVTTLTLRDALTAPLYALWDEDRGCMIRFPRHP